MSLPYSADAVLAEHIGDEKTPRAIGKQWRVAFYKKGTLFAVMPLPFTRVRAEKAAAAAEMAMEQAVEMYIAAVAEKEPRQ